MSSQPLEIILSRQFADSINIGAFLINPDGDLLFYNTEAEEILGQRFSETGSMKLEEWSIAFIPKDKKGNPIPANELPLVKSLETSQPTHGNVYIESKKGVRYEIAITALPIEGKDNELLGAMALFWKTDKE